MLSNRRKIVNLVMLSLTGVFALFAVSILFFVLGYLLWTGGLALGVMMIPISLRSTEDFLRAVPLALREGAMALGASKSKAIFTVVIPAAMSGIITGTMLNVARVAGETAPLLFTSLGNRY